MNYHGVWWAWAPKDNLQGFGPGKFSTREAAIANASENGHAFVFIGTFRTLGTRELVSSLSIINQIRDLADNLGGSEHLMFDRADLLDNFLEFWCSTHTISNLWRVVGQVEEVATGYLSEERISYSEV